MAEITGTISRKEVESRVSAMIPRLYVICRAWGAAADVCDEVVQEAVTKALTCYQQLRDPRALETWLISILNNCHRMYWRTHRNDATYDESAHADNNTPDTCLESERTVRQVRQAISHLGENHRKVITLIDMEGLSYREVADVLDIRIGTVMSRISRARNNLRYELKEILGKQENQRSASVLPIRSIT